LLISCYDLGHQPLSLAWPLALLREAGLPAATLDLAVEPFDEGLARAAGLVAIAAPMHTALRLGVVAAERVRAVNPEAHICFWGLYAGLNAAYLLSGIADSVVPGEDEAALVRLAQALGAGAGAGGVAGVQTRQKLEEIPAGAAGAEGAPAARHNAQVAQAVQPLGAPARPRLPVPDRTTLPSLARYSRYVKSGRAVLAGYTEATRGCLHTCRHCPIVPIYGGRFFAVPAETVLADIRQQVRAGAEHLTFGDPDFLNGPGHALRLARALHTEFPHLSFDFTTKVEHIVRHRGLFAEFAALGATFVTSAVESLSPLVLERLQKGHSPRDVATALAVLDAAGIALRPTLVAFTPWTTLDDYLRVLDFVEAHGLQAHVPPIQLAVRLLLPPGSPLIHAPDAAEWLGPLDAPSLTYTWRHPDPRMDALYARVAERVAQAEATDEPVAETYSAVRALALAAAGGAPARPPVTVPAIGPARARPRPVPPRLTENWFC
jgi:hypothetical protein